MDSPAIAARIAALLEEKGWTARELARRAGFGEGSAQASNTIKRLSDGKGASLKTLRALAKALGVTEAWLIDSLASALKLEMRDDDLPGLIVGAYVRAQGLILLERSLTETLRAPVASHECSHATLHARAPHDEVSYLAMAHLFPARLLRSLPRARRTVSASWLLRAVTYPAPLWAAEYRAPILQRLLDADRY